jgi:predicted regulator of Ras-like GTPase activity (Roadblock/LC7/MglB family)
MGEAGAGHAVGPLLASAAMAQDAPLADLLSISRQVREAAVVGASGFVVECSTAPERGEELARAGAELLAAAESLGGDRAAVARVEVLDRDGGLFVVRDEDRTIVATTVPDATPGLVVYDLRTALERLERQGPAAGADA